MKRILLVDDEPMARQHIRESFPWEKWGFEIAGEATNGSEALVLAAELRPDIALIDITMPVMDGLKLLDHMNQQFPDTKCIILTAHRDFVYAQQALQNGAFGYVLKSPIDLVGAKAALDRAAKASERELHHATTTKKQQILLQSNHYPLRKHFFEQVLSSLLAGDNEIIQRSETLGADLEAGSLLLLVCEVDRLPLFRSRYPETDHSLIEYSLLEIIRESLHEFIPGRFELFPIHFGKMALILTFEERLPDRETYQQLCIQIEQKVEEPLQKYLQLQISIAASEPFSQPHHIRSLYKQTSELLLYRFYQEHPRTIFTNGLFPLNPLSEKGLICLNETAAQIKDQTSADTLHQHYENIKLLLLQMRSKPADVIRWFHSLKDLLYFGAHLPAWPKFEECLSVYDTIQLLEDWSLKRQRTKAEALTIRPEIARALQFIRKHLHEELNLENIAGEADLSPSHFGHLFKKEIGTSVIDYVLEQRMELAKTYLTEGRYRNYELAEKVGFKHYSYFSSMFKKLTGMNPNEFRRSAKQIVPKRQE